MRQTKIKVITHWATFRGELPPAWRRLWDKLLAVRKDKLAGTGEATGNGECKNGEKGDI